MASIFGPLDKRQRAATDALASAEGDLSFEDRADLFNDLLEEDVSTFPLLSCPSEVLSSVLLLSEVSAALRFRPVCGQMRTAVDGNTGLWCSLILRDFADMGGSTKHYRGLRTLADAKDDSRAVARLEWDPMMICAPPPLRYTLLASSKARRRRWDEFGHSLGAGWAWFSSRVCRRMATSTFLRWASLQHEPGAVARLADDGGQSGGQPGCQPGGQTPTPAAAAAADAGPGQKFRCGRADAVNLSAAAVADIHDTVQRWHNKAHCDMMRAHFAKPEQSPGNSPGQARQEARDAAQVAGFSFTPTLDAAEAAAFAADAEVTVPLASATESPSAAGRRGLASRRIEEAQLRLALELSKEEAEASQASAETPTPRHSKAKAAAADTPQLGGASPAGATPREQEPACLALRAASDGPAPMVFLKPHCLAHRVEQLPESLEKSIEHIVHKMTTPAAWGLLYESVTEELGFRAKSAAHSLCAAHSLAMDELLNQDISLKQERVCLPIWRSSRESVRRLSQLRVGDAPAVTRRRRCELLRQASLEWCELEDLTEFLDSQLAPLELAIDNFRGEQEMSSKAHTPHVRDLGRLMFRNFCLLDSRVFRPLCLAAYSLVHEVHGATETDSDQGGLMDLLEGVHAMLGACDVADDDLSNSKATKDAFVEHFLEPISAAVEALGAEDVRGHPSRSIPSARCGTRVVCR